MKKAIIFDMYGVVLRDSYGGLMPFVNRHFPNHTRDHVYPHWLEGAVGGLTCDELWRRIGFAHNLEALDREYLDTIEIDDAFFAAAAVLRGRYKLALLTNDLSEWSAYLRDKFALDREFDVVVVSGDMKMKKPDPAIYRETAAQLNLAPHECLFVDDIPKNLDGAQAVGMDVVLFNRLGFTYDGPTVDSFPELVDHIRRIDRW